MEKGKKRPFFQYSEERMETAIAACRNGMPFSTAAKMYEVPRSTLKNKVKGRTPVARKMGPPSVLSKAEENALVKWITEISNRGFSPHKDDLLITVQKIMRNTNRQNPFINDKPGRKWLDAFFKRNPSLSVRIPETLTTSRASVSEQQLRNWFKEVYTYLENENLLEILNFPERIFNCDESAFQICPKSNKVIGPRGEKNVYEIAKGSEKESITVAITVSANGTLLPPFLLFSYARLPGPLISNVPNEWAVGKSDKGWMTGESFYEYITNVFYPWLIKNKITFPIILFIDGHQSHLTLHLSNFCEENKIILVALYPNATHIIQPCDVAVFKPLKDNWRKVVHKWRLDHTIEILNKTTFPLMFSEALKGVNKECIINGFRKCGLYPWSPDAVDYTKCMKDRQINLELMKKDSLPQENTHLKYIEQFINSDILNSFRECYGSHESWSGDPKWLELYNVWLKIKKIHDATNNLPLSKQKVIEKHTQFRDRSSSSTCTTSQKSVTENSSVNLETSSTMGQANLEENLKLTDASSFKTSNETVVLDAVEMASNENTPPKAIIDNSQLQTPDTTKFLVENKVLSPILLNDNSNLSVGTPFKNALMWPEKKDTKLKRKRNVDRTPSVVTSREWKKFMRQKEEKKQNEEKLKEERKRLRYERNQIKLKEKEQRLLQLNKKKKTETQESSDDTDESISYADTSSASEKFSDLEQTSVKENISSDTLNTQVALRHEEYYAVFYEEQYFIGRITSIDHKNSKATIKFLKEISENSFLWPTKNDVDEVHLFRIFFGPLDLIGNEPFSIDNIVLKKIKTAYRAFKVKSRLYE